MERDYNEFDRRALIDPEDQIISKGVKLKKAKRINRVCPECDEHITPGFFCIEINPIFRSNRYDTKKIWERVREYPVCIHPECWENFSKKVVGVLDKFKDEINKNKLLLAARKI